MREIENMKIENLIKGLQILEPYCKKPTDDHLGAWEEVIYVRPNVSVTPEHQQILKELGFEEYLNFYGEIFSWGFECENDL